MGTARTKFKRKQIIRAKNGEVYLILAISDIGVNILKFKTGGLWNNIPSLSCTIEGDLRMNACIEGVSLMTWGYFEKKGFIVLSTMYDFKYNQIVNSICDYYKGLIVSKPAPEGLIYIDEYEDLIKSVNDENKKEESPKASVEDSSEKETSQQDSMAIRSSSPMIFGKKKIVVELAPLETDQSASEEIHTEIATPAVEEIFDTIDTEGVQDNTENSINDSESTSVINEEISKSEEIKAEKRYDILQMYRDYCNEFKKNKTSEKGIQKREYKRRKYDYYIPPLTENECLELCYMPVEAIALKYNIPSSVSRGIKREAKKIFSSQIDEDKKESSKAKDVRSEILRLFKEGKTKEEIDELFPSDKNKIQEVYKKYTISIDKNTSPEEVDLLKAELEKKEICELIQYEKCPVTSFAQKFKLSYKDAFSLLSHLRANVIARDPFIICGFEYGIQIDNVPEKDMYVYLSIEEIKDVYLDTFDHHGEILAGTFEIPTNIGRVQKENLIKLIKNRFYRKKYKIEYMDNEQKSVYLSDKMNIDLVRSAFLIAGNRAATFINSSRIMLKARSEKKEE